MHDFEYYSGKVLDEKCIVIFKKSIILFIGMNCYSVCCLDIDGIIVLKYVMKIQIHYYLDSLDNNTYLNENSFSNKLLFSIIDTRNSIY